jgi:hypothetical protein
MNGTVEHDVKQNKLDWGRQLSRFPSYAESRSSQDDMNITGRLFEWGAVEKVMGSESDSSIL